MTNGICFWIVNGVVVGGCGHPHATFVLYCIFLIIIIFFSARPSLWDIEFANQLATSVNHQPRNGLEEMIQWTKEGKLWRYPINNEDGDCYI